MSYSGAIYSLIVYNNDLIAGDYFTTAGGNSATNIAKWNGTSWSPLGSGISSSSNPMVYSLTIYNNELIAGGCFTTAGGVSANSIAKWNGTSWSALGSGMGGVTNPAVYALNVYNNDLIAGGYFTTAGGINATSIAKWNSTSWSAVGTNNFNNVFFYGLYAHNNELYACGDLAFCVGSSCLIGKWNGTTWLPLGTGLSGWTAYALIAYNNYIVVGGQFIAAGGVPAYYIAKWGTISGLNLENHKLPAKFNLSQSYPNPFNPITKIRFDIPKTNNVTLKIFDITGKVITTLINEKLNAGTCETEWNAENYPSGVYFYTLTAKDFKETKRMVLVK